VEAVGVILGSLSQKIATVRALYEAFNRRDFDAYVRHLHSDAELHPGVTGGPVRTHYHGRDGFRRFLETIIEVSVHESPLFEDYTVSAEEVIEAPGGRILAVEHWRLRTRDGIDLDTRIFDLYEFRDELVVRVAGFRDKGEAFKAAGLPD
jgi:ketosteroid isomerase-like protein